MNCAESLDWLQLRLDGEPLPDAPALQRHLATCAECRGLHAAIEPLTTGLRLLPVPVPSPGLSARVARAVVQDRRQRFRRRTVSVLAAAACLLVAALIGWPRGKSVDPVAQATPTERRTPEPTPSVAPVEMVSVRKGLYDYGNALVSVVSHTADQTLGQGKLLLPERIPSGAVDTVQPMPEMTHSPAVLQEAGEGISAGVEPFANKFRSAAGSMNFIWRAPAEPNRR